MQFHVLQKVKQISQNNEAAKFLSKRSKNAICKGLFSALYLVHYSEYLGKPGCVGLNPSRLQCSFDCNERCHFK